MTTIFSMRHAIAGSEEEFWTLVNGNEEFNERMYKEDLGFGYELINDGSDGSERKALIIPAADAPKAVQKVLGDGAFYEVGKNTAEREYTFRIEPKAMSTKIDVNGRMWTEPNGQTGCFRCTELSVSVKIFGVGKIVESFIESSTRKNYDNSAKFTDRYLAEKRG